MCTASGVISILSIVLNGVEGRRETLRLVLYLQLTWMPEEAGSSVCRNTVSRPCPLPIILRSQCKPSVAAPHHSYNHQVSTSNMQFGKPYLAVAHTVAAGVNQGFAIYQATLGRLA